MIIIEIKQLEYFVEIVDCGTFSHAAEKNFVTQPALSKIIKKLEAELGINLLYSQGKKTVPTEAGQILLIQAKKILHECRNTVDMIEDLKGNPTGTLHISTPGFWNRMPKIYEMIKSFIQAYPNVTLDIKQSDSTTYREKLTTGVTDIAFICGLRPDDPSLECMPLISDSYYFVMPKDLPLVQKELIEWADVATQPLALLTRTYQLYQTAMNEFHKLGITPNIRMTADSLPFILDITAENHWCTIIGETFTDKDKVQYPDMICVPLNAPNEFCMLRRRESYASQAERCFVNFVKENWQN